MRLGILFSGGKDSTYATYLAKKFGHEIVCLISIFSKNKDSFMFHTPTINLTKEQADRFVDIFSNTVKGVCNSAKL